MLLGLLPEEFENFSVAIESRDDIPGLENLKVKLIEEEARQNDRMTKKEQESSNNDEVLLTKQTRERPKQTNINYRNNTKWNNNKFVGKCFNCGRMGHKSFICRSKINSNNSKKVHNTLTAIAYNAGIMEKSEIWCLDSGATRHMCNNRNKFTKFNSNEKSKVYTAAKHYIKSAGSGIVTLTMKSKQCINYINLQNVLYVPDLSNNLLSVSQITSNGYRVTFQKDKAIVSRKDKSVVLTAFKQGQLYIIKDFKEYAKLTKEKTDENLIKWHQRCVHLNLADLQKMKNEEIVCGMNFMSKVSQIDCEICARCKIHTLPFKQSMNREKEILGLVHSDICGPMSTESLGGAKYFVTFIDDYTRYVETIMLLQAFKNYKRRAEKQTGYQIKKLRTDNGKKYLSQEFNNLLKEEGILRQLTVEYTPQQNGVAERANRTLVEMARCILLQAKLPNLLWAEAINAATYIRNRCATKCLNGITPIEAWSKRKPYIGYFRTIGSKAIVMNKNQRRNKFQPKGDEYILVGYSNESKAYRLWKKGTRTIIKARDVKFIEKIELPTILSTNIIMPNTLINVSNEENNEQFMDENNEQFMNENNQRMVEQEENERDEQYVHEENKEVDKNFVRIPGRPKIIRTGKPGRPRKNYNTKKI